MSQHEKVLENCRWLFSQEVKLVYFLHAVQAKEEIWHAVVVPKTCSFKSSTPCDILFNSADYPARSKSAIENLYWAIGTKIGQILQAGLSGPLQIGGSINCTRCKAHAEPTTSGTVSTGTQTTPRPTEIIEIPKGQEGLISVVTQEIQKKKPNEVKPRTTRTVTLEPSGRLQVEEYEPETPQRIDHMEFDKRRPVKIESQQAPPIWPNLTTRDRGQLFDINQSRIPKGTKKNPSTSQTKVSSADTQALPGSFILTRKTRLPSSFTQLNADNPTEHYTESDFTPNASVLDDAGSDTTAAPKPASKGADMFRNHERRDRLYRG